MSGDLIPRCYNATRSDVFSFPGIQLVPSQASVVSRRIFVLVPSQALPYTYARPADDIIKRGSRQLLTIFLTVHNYVRSTIEHE